LTVKDIFFSPYSVSKWMVLRQKDIIHFIQKDTTMLEQIDGFDLFKQAGGAAL